MGLLHRLVRGSGGGILPSSRSGGGCKGRLRALVDPQIRRVLSLIHEKPEDDRTVESRASKILSALEFPSSAAVQLSNRARTSDS